MTIAVVVILMVMLSGCAVPFDPSRMTAEQISAMAKIKDANVLCLHLANPMYGKGVSVWINVDKGIPAGMTIKDGCEVTFSAGETKTPAK